MKYKFVQYKSEAMRTSPRIVSTSILILLAMWIKVQICLGQSENSRTTSKKNESGEGESGSKLPLAQKSVDFTVDNTDTSICLTSYTDSLKITFEYQFFFGHLDLKISPKEMQPLPTGRYAEARAMLDDYNRQVAYIRFREDEIPKFLELLNKYEEWCIATKKEKLADNFSKPMGEIGSSPKGTFTFITPDTLQIYQTEPSENEYARYKGEDAAKLVGKLKILFSDGFLIFRQRINTESKQRELKNAERQKADSVLK